MMVLPLGTLLAQSGGGRPLSEWTLHDSVRLGIAVGLVIILVLILGVVLLQVRRRMLEKDTGSEMGAAGSMLEELRRARARGEMTDAEYEAARRAATARAVEKGGRAEPPKPATRLTARPGAPPPPPGAVVAKPGFDLTGAPLPRPDTEAQKE